MPKRMEVEVEPQPDGSSCGPTCLHALYRYWGDRIPLAKVLAEVPRLETGGTLAVQLGCHALRRGYDVLLYTHNLDVFDPTWFSTPGIDLAERLQAQLRVKDKRKLHVATPSYLEFLALGGELRMQDLDRGLLRRYLKRRVPILSGLSATWLYRCAREVGDEETEYDDLRGVSQGHFVVLHGYQQRGQRVHVADPETDNPFAPSRQYVVELDRLISAIHLGVLTYDANLLIVTPKAREPEPKDERRRRRARKRAD